MGEAGIDVMILLEITKPKNAENDRCSLLNNCKGN
jgi:hypothetical protein